jgi:16S rRNA (uracil1498-N3)-methyltransferase
VRVHLYQSITKGERFEWLVEKATEIGVSRIVPLVAARAVVRTPAAGNRIDRWRRIATEAAEQCERSAVPGIDAPCDFTAALAEAPGVRLFPDESAGERAPGIAAALAAEIDAVFAQGEISVLIGPEGGWTPDEVALAASAEGTTVVTLGERVLRSETAGLVAATLVLQATGDLG